MKENNGSAANKPTVGQTKTDVNLEVDKIKDLYVSFDSGKLTSTLLNLDIEEMCFCLSCALIKHIEFGM